MPTLRAMRTPPRPGTDHRARSLGLAAVAVIAIAAALIATRPPPDGVAAVATLVPSVDPGTPTATVAGSGAVTATGM